MTSELSYLFDLGASFSDQRAALIGWKHQPEGDGRLEGGAGTRDHQSPLVLQTDSHDEDENEDEEGWCRVFLLSPSSDKHTHTLPLTSSSLSVIRLKALYTHSVCPVMVMILSGQEPRCEQGSFFIHSQTKLVSDPFATYVNSESSSSPSSSP